MKLLFFAAALFVASISAAQSRSLHRGLNPGCNILFPCDTSYEAHRTVREPRRVAYSVSGRPEAGIMNHPSGCPRIAFCGCGAAVRVFGHPVPSLALAASWYRFPRALLAVGNVAVRPHHVFVVEQVLENGMVMAYDANSGRHATRIHARSVAGYTIVNPRG